MYSYETRMDTISTAYHSYDVVKFTVIQFSTLHLNNNFYSWFRLIKKSARRLQIIAWQTPRSETEIILYGLGGSSAIFLVNPMHRVHTVYSRQMCSLAEGNMKKCASFDRSTRKKCLLFFRSVTKNMHIRVIQWWHHGFQGMASSEIGTLPWFQFRHLEILPARKVLDEWAALRLSGRDLIQPNGPPGLHRSTSR